MKWNVKNVLHVLNVPESLPKLPNLNFGKHSAANLFCLNWGRNIFLYRFSELLENCLVVYEINIWFLRCF